MSYLEIREEFLESSSPIPGVTLQLSRLAEYFPTPTFEFGALALTDKGKLFFACRVSFPKEGKIEINARSRADIVDYYRTDILDDSQYPFEGWAYDASLSIQEKERRLYGYYKK